MDTRVAAIWFLTAIAGFGQVFHLAAQVTPVTPVTTVTYQDNVTLGGNGYFTAPAVTISGGGGSGATETL